MQRLLITFLTLLCAPLLAFAQVPAIAAAANKFVPGVTLKKESIVAGNFSCRGRVERAILGTKKSEIVVAIFLRSLRMPPTVLRYSANTRDPTTSELKVEDWYFEPMEFENLVGHLPDGLRPSRTCKGLNLSDGRIDSAHIYWNHNTKKFSDWTL